MKNLHFFTAVYVISITIFVYVGMLPSLDTVAIFFIIALGVMSLFLYLRDIEKNQEKIMKYLGIVKEAEKFEMDKKEED